MWKYILLLLGLMTRVSASPVDEIEGLLAFVGRLQPASFLRDGEAYAPTMVVGHLRMNWTKQKSQIVTAEDFIRSCATRSSMSGAPYIIVFPDGHEEPSAQVFLRQLQKIRSEVARGSISPLNPNGVETGGIARVRK